MAPAGARTHIFWVWGGVIRCFRGKHEFWITYFASAGSLRWRCVIFPDIRPPWFIITFWIGLNVTCLLLLLASRRVQTGRDQTQTLYVQMSTEACVHFILFKYTAFRPVLISGWPVYPKFDFSFKINISTHNCSSNEYVPLNVLNMSIFCFGLSGHDCI